MLECLRDKREQVARKIPFKSFTTCTFDICRLLEKYGRIWQRRDYGLYGIR